MDEPIDTSSGAHVINRALLEVKGAQNLAFAIDYNSICNSNDILGNGWSHNFEASITPTANGLLLSWNAKKCNLFTPQPGNSSVFLCPDPPVVYDSITANPDGSYTLTEPTQQKLNFDSLGRLAQIVNPHGQAINLSYGPTHLQPFQIQEMVSGNSFYLSYDTSNRLMQVSNIIGQVASFAYDGSNNLSTISKSFLTTTQSWIFTYWAPGQVASEVSPEGNKVFRDFCDDAGRVVVQQDSVNNYAIFSYDTSQTNYLITTVVDRTGATNVFLYDTNYNLLAITNGLGDASTYAYDTNDNETSFTNALGYVETYAYDGAGNQVSTTDMLGYTTYFTYDSRNNLLAITNALNGAASFAYDAKNNITNSVDFMTNRITMQYDANCLMTQKTSPRGGVTRFAYAGGLLTSVTDAVTNTTTFGYDPIGRLIAVTNADGFVTTNGYDLNNNLTATCDGLGNTWCYTCDSSGQRTHCYRSPHELNLLGIQWKRRFDRRNERAQRHHILWL